VVARDPTFGAYVRQLRANKGWSLLALSEHTHLNYQNLSRIENDSTVPSPETVVTLADALGGDLNYMLQLADCLPKQILERLVARPSSQAARRAAGGPAKPSASGPNAKAAALARSLGVPDAEIADVADAVVHLLELDARRRHAVVQLMKTFDGGGRAGQR